MSEIVCASGEWSGEWSGWDTQIPKAKKTMGGPTWSYELRVSEASVFEGLDGSKADGCSMNFRDQITSDSIR
jgi:hypothetical protein